MDPAAAAVQPGRVKVKVDESVLALDEIEYIVVLMMENRSYDYIFGFLTLSGRRPELDGLRLGMANVYRNRSGKFPQYDGLSFPIHELLDTRMKKSQDPAHAGASVDKQLAQRNGGFLQVYMDEPGGPPEVHPSDVMGYHTDLHVPVYDHLSEKFCVCDRFSSVPGATFPNRLYALAGRAAGKRDNEHPCPSCTGRSPTRWPQSRRTQSTNSSPSERSLALAPRPKLPTCNTTTCNSAPAS
jgi:phospholipase C